VAREASAGSEGSGPTISPPPDAFLSAAGATPPPPPRGPSTGCGSEARMAAIAAAASLGAVSAASGFAGSGALGLLDDPDSPGTDSASDGGRGASAALVGGGSQGVGRPRGLGEGDASSDGSDSSGSSSGRVRSGPAARRLLLPRQHPSDATAEGLTISAECGSGGDGGRGLEGGYDFQTTISTAPASLGSTHSLDAVSMAELGTNYARDCVVQQPLLPR
jgi:hypothetical protein